MNPSHKGHCRCAVSEEGDSPPPKARTEARARRIAELTAQVRSGTYHPDPRQVVEALLRRESDLFQLP